MTRKRTHIMIDEALDRRIRILAEIEGRKFSAQVERALHGYMAEIPMETATEIQRRLQTVGDPS